MVELRAAGNVIFMLERGVLDRRATLAFSTGQCHGLALALSRRTGYPLVAVFDSTGDCVHVCVRDPAGRLIDVAGAHDEVDFVGDGERSVRPASPSFINALTLDHGWAPADPVTAEAWVDAVLERVRRGERLAALAVDKMRLTVPAGDDGLELCIEWVGEPHISVFVRWVGDVEWTLYSHVAFPPDADGRHRIDFTTERFCALAEAWVQRQFDPGKARRRLAAADR